MTSETSEPPLRSSRSSSAKPAGVARGALVTGAGTLVSRILGVLRERVIASFFPVEQIDLWIIAFTIPNTLRGLLAEGAASAAFVPIYSELRTQDEGRARAFHARARGALALVLVAVCVVGALAAPLWVRAFAPGYADDPHPFRFETTVALTRMLFPYIFFMGMAALSAGALNSHRAFVVPALAPALLNVAMVAAPFLLLRPFERWDVHPLKALAVGALVGGGLQVVAQWPALARRNLWIRPKLDLHDPDLRRAARLLLPMVIALGVYQLNIALSRTIASYLPPGSQTYLTFGQRLVEIPQGMFAMATAASSLPVLSELRACDDSEGLKRTFQNALSGTLFVALPASAMLIVLAEPIVMTVFGFRALDAQETARSLAWQAAGVVAVAAVRVTVPVFLAHTDTRTPLRGSVLNLLVFASSAVALSFWLSHVGIAIAIGVAGVAQLGLLLLALRRKIGALGLAKVGRELAKASVASAFMSVAAYEIAALGSFGDGVDLLDAMILFVALALGGVVYLGVAWALGSQEPRALSARFAARFGPRR